MHLSNIFSLCLGGRNNDKEVVNLVFGNLESPKKLQLQNLLYSGAKKKLLISFHCDDWTTNAVKKELLEFQTASIDANCARF